MVDIITITFGLLAVVLIFRLYQKQTNAVCKSTQRLSDKVAIVTGGTAGIGLEVAKDLANRGAKVIIACPFEEEGKVARETIIRSTLNNNIIFKNLDLRSLESTRSFANDILQQEEKLDILVNNAGGVFDCLTKDGFNATIQVNYMGHFLLTLLLLPLLKKSKSGRIVSVASIMHWIGYYEDGNFDKIKYWWKVQAYANSKLYIILFARELKERLKDTNITINTLHPGAVGTQIHYSLGIIFGRLVSWLFSFTCKTAEEGAQTTIYLAVDPEVKDISGQYFSNCARASTSWIASNKKTSAELWEKTRQLVRLRDEEIVL